MVLRIFQFVIIPPFQLFLLFPHWENENEKDYFIHWCGCIFSSSTKLLIKLLKIFAKGIIFYLLLVFPSVTKNSIKKLQRLRKETGYWNSKCRQCLSSDSSRSISIYRIFSGLFTCVDKALLGGGYLKPSNIIANTP